MPLPGQIKYFIKHYVILNNAQVEIFLAKIKCYIPVLHLRNYYRKGEQVYSGSIHERAGAAI